MLTSSTPCVCVRACVRVCVCVHVCVRVCSMHSLQVSSVHQHNCRLRISDIGLSGKDSTLLLHTNEATETERNYYLSRETGH